MTEHNEMPKEIFLEISDLPKRFCANFNATSYTRTDTIPDHTALLKQARDDIKSLLLVLMENGVCNRKYDTLGIAINGTITAIDNALKGSKNG